MGVLNKEGRVNAFFFNFPTKNKFTKEMKKKKENSIEEKSYKIAFDKIAERVFGIDHHKNTLVSRHTFVSKFEFVELFNFYSKYKQVHGKIGPIKMKIIDI